MPDIDPQPFPIATGVPPTPPAQPSPFAPEKLAAGEWPALYTLIGWYLLGSAVISVRALFLLPNLQYFSSTSAMLLTFATLLPVLCEIPAACGLFVKQHWGCRLAVASAGLRLLINMVQAGFSIYTLYDIASVGTGKSWSVSLLGIILGLVSILASLLLYGTIIVIMLKKNRVTGYGMFTGISGVVLFIGIYLLARALYAVDDFLLPIQLMLRYGESDRLYHQALTLNPSLTWSIITLFAVIPPMQLTSGVLLLRGMKSTFLLVNAVLGLMCLLILVKQVAFYLMFSISLMNFNIIEILRKLTDGRSILYIAGNLLQLIAMMVYLSREGRARHA